MALTDQERAFMTDALASGVPEDVAVAKVKESRAKRLPQGPHPGRGDELQPDTSSDVLYQPISNLGAGAVLPRGGARPASEFALNDRPPEDPESRANIDFVKRQLATTVAGAGVGGIVGPALGQGATALGRIGRAALTGAASGGAGNAAGEAAAGGSARDVAGAAGWGALGGAGISSGAATVGELLTGAAAATKASKGGQAAALIKKYGGNVGPLDSGSGIPELDGLKTVTDADIGAQARASGQKLIGANDRMFDAEGRQPYKAATAAIEAPPSDGGIPASQRPVDVTALRQKMMEISLDPATDPAVKSVLENQMAEMEHLPRNQRGVYIADERWVNGKTQMFMRLAKPDKLAAGAGTPRDAVFGEVAGVGQALREQGPYAEANAAYASAKNRSGDFRQALGMKRAPNVDEEVDAAKAANFLARRNQTTTTAGIRGTGERLQQLTQQYPELQRTIDAPNIVAAKATLQPGLGRNVGGLIGRQPGHLLIDAALHNKDVIAGRLLAGAPAGAAMATGQAMGQAAPDAALAAMNAYQAKRLNDAAVIDGIFGKQQARTVRKEDQQQQGGQ